MLAEGKEGEDVRTSWEGRGGKGRKGREGQKR